MISPYTSTPIIHYFKANDPGLSPCCDGQVHGQAGAGSLIPGTDDTDRPPER